MQTFRVYGWVKAISFTADGTRLAVAFDPEDRKAGPGTRVFDCRTAAPISPADGTDAYRHAGSIDHSADGRWVAATEDVGARVWPADRPDQLYRLMGEGEANRIRFSPDSKAVFLLERGSVRAWRLADGGWGEWFRVEVGTWYRDLLAVSRDGRFVAAAVRPHIHLIEVAGKEIVVRRWESEFHPNGMEFGSESSELLICGYNSVRRLSSATGAAVPLPIPRGHVMNDLALSPDGRTLATAGDGGIVRFWDAESWEPREEFRWPVKQFECVRFAPDGLRCAAGGSDGTVVVWDVE